MRANADCIENKRDMCEVSIPSLGGTWVSKVGGPQKYQFKSLKAIQKKFARAAAADGGQRLVELMKATNCFGVLAADGSRAKL